MDSLHPQDDFSSRFFIWHEWIQANGPLSRQNALDYFATSMFYDKQSNNQVLRMQTMHTGMPLENEAEDLKRFTGLEFALVHDEAPTLFIIHKRDRLSPDEVRPLAAFFIMHNRIYQAPDVYNVISNRLLATLSSLQASLSTLLNHKPDFTPRSGFIWPVSQARPATEDSDPRKHADESMNEEFIGSKRNKIVTKKQENATLLFNAMRTTAAQTQILAAAPSLVHAPEGSEHQAEVSAARTSATPGASSRAPSRPAAFSPDATQDSTTKPPPGGGKKKRKRTLVTSS